MLVGAGGNAGNQSAIKVIRGLATGQLEPTFSCLLRSLKQQVTEARHFLAPMCPDLCVMVHRPALASIPSRAADIPSLHGAADASLLYQYSSSVLPLFVQP